MTDKGSSISFTIQDVGALLLANLSVGIYNAEAVLREYVQNACDAYQAMPITPAGAAVKISIEDEDTIAIQDQGIGMDLTDVRDSIKIAVSPKRSADFAGFRGIGIWAGLTACKRLEIISKKAGHDQRYRLQLDFDRILADVRKNIDIGELINGRIRYFEDPEDKAKHYTRVRLIGLNSGYRQLAIADELKRIVSQLLPCKPSKTYKHVSRLSDFYAGLPSYSDFSILVNSEEVFKDFPDEVGDFKDEKLTHGGTELARVWYTSGTSSLSTEGYQTRSFRLRVKNFAVGDLSIYGAEEGMTYGLTDSKYRMEHLGSNWPAEGCQGLCQTRHSSEEGKWRRRSRVLQGRGRLRRREALFGSDRCCGSTDWG
jgi:hypothetical protein